MEYNYVTTRLADVSILLPVVLQDTPFAGTQEYAPPLLPFLPPYPSQRQGQASYIYKIKELISLGMHDH